jgi:hypothetical protein
VEPPENQALTVSCRHRTRLTDPHGAAREENSTDEVLLSRCFRRVRCILGRGLLCRRGTDRSGRTGLRVRCRPNFNVSFTLARR